MKSKLRILVVEDEPIVRNFIHHLLTHFDFSVLMCENGSRAKDLLADEAVDILITDLLMPELDGFELIEWVREKQAIPWIIVISGETSFETKKRAFSKGANYFLEKPVMANELIDLLNNISGMSQN